MNKKFLTKGALVLATAVALSATPAVPYSHVSVFAAENAETVKKLNAITVMVDNTEKTYAVNLDKAKDLGSISYMIGTAKEDQTPVINWTSVTAAGQLLNPSDVAAITSDISGTPNGRLSLSVLTNTPEHKDKLKGKKIFFRSDENNVSGGIALGIQPDVAEEDYTISTDAEKNNWVITFKEKMPKAQYKVDGAGDWTDADGKNVITVTGLDTTTKKVTLRYKGEEGNLASFGETEDYLVSPADLVLKAEYDKITFTATNNGKEPAKHYIDVELKDVTTKTDIQYKFAENKTEALKESDWEDLSEVTPNSTISTIKASTIDKKDKSLFFRKKKSVGTNYNKTLSMGVGPLEQHTALTLADYELSDDAKTITLKLDGLEYSTGSDWKDVENRTVTITGDGGTVNFRKKASGMKLASEQFSVKVPEATVAAADLNATVEIKRGNAIVLKGVDNLTKINRDKLKYSTDSANYFFVIPEKIRNNVKRVSDIVLVLSEKEVKALETGSNKFHLKVDSIKNSDDITVNQQDKNTVSGLTTEVLDGVDNGKVKVKSLASAKKLEFSWQPSDITDRDWEENVSKDAAWVDVKLDSNHNFVLSYNGSYFIREKADLAEGSQKLASQTKRIDVTTAAVTSPVYETNPAVKKEEPKKEDPKKEEPKKDDTKTEAPKTEEPKTETPSEEAPVNKTVSSKKAAATVSAEDVALVTGKLIVKVKGATLALPKAVLSDGAVKVSLKASTPKKDSKDAKALTKNLKKNKLVDKNVYSLSVKSGKKNVKGKFTVTLKTTLKKAPKKLYVMNVANGKLMKAKFKKGMVTFTAGMTGKFVVVSK